MRHGDLTLEDPGYIKQVRFRLSFLSLNLSLSLLSKAKGAIG
jgi:hypothetical protein